MQTFHTAFLNWSIVFSKYLQHFFAPYDNGEQDDTCKIRLMTKSKSEHCDLTKKNVVGPIRGTSDDNSDENFNTRLYLI